MLSPSRSLFAFITICLAFCCGCGGPKPEGNPVAGVVELNGAPLESGRITFVPEDGKGVTAGGEIKKGRFEVHLTPGPKLVQITAEKVVGKVKPYPDDPKSPEYDKIEQFLPARYNTASELKCTVEAGQKKDLKFSLDVAAPAS